MISKIVLKVSNLKKYYGTHLVVDNVSFDVHAGEIMGFLGPNGAGKTTTIKMITGLTKISSGDVFINGFSVKTNFESAIAKVGAIIENPDMYGYMSGKENLYFYAKLYKKVRKSKIASIVDIVDLTDRINDKVKTYSLGMKQRLGIAQALLNDPKLLILDEPTNGLDPAGIRDMRILLKHLAVKYNIAILISSHNLKEMQDLCDTVAIINDAKLIDVQPVSSITKLMEDSGRIAVTVDYPNFAGKILVNHLKLNVEIDGSEVIFKAPQQKIPEITSLLISKHLSIFAINTVTKNLEDIYFEKLKAQKGKI